MSREAVFAALFALVSQGEGLPGTITWGAGQTLKYTSRRLRLWDDVKSQPALCQGEPDETYSRQPNLPPKRILRANWFVYHQSGKGSATPAATANNQILDALDAALNPSPFASQTLGGLVTRAWIDGKVFKDAGDLDGAQQALLIVPLALTLP